jgi:hypothetical protein
MFGVSWVMRTFSKTLPGRRGGGPLAPPTSSSCWPVILTELVLPPSIFCYRRVFCTRGPLPTRSPRLWPHPYMSLRGPEIRTHGIYPRRMDILSFVFAVKKKGTIPTLDMPGRAGRPPIKTKKQRK